MIRVLHIVSYMQRGGLETLIMNCYRHIDREKLQFDFIVHRDFRSDYDDEIEALGGKIYRLPRLNPFSPFYRKAMLDFFRKHPEYRIVHCHLDCMSALPLSAAKRCGVPVRIAHAHSSNQTKDWKYPLKRFFMQGIPGVATHFFACSKTAGKWMFPDQNITVVNNGIDTAKFAFNAESRAEMRAELGLGSELVLGHTGRFMPEKNHSFLIDVFAEVHRRDPQSKLILIGTGPLEKQIKEKVRGLHLTDAVEFLGVRPDVNRILQAVDVFVLPSVYEGFGIAAVEAQTAGAKCVVSDQVPEMCRITENICALPLDAPAGEWAERILAAGIKDRSSQQERIKAAGFDIAQTADWLQSFYIKLEA